MYIIRMKKALAIIAAFIVMVSICFINLPTKTAHAANSESESNNTAATANTISVNSSVSANLSSSSDVDWFKFTTSQNGYFYIEFNHTLLSSSSSYWKIFIYDSSATNNVDGSSSYYSVAGNSNMTTNSFGVPAGTYYLKITKDSYSDNSYNFNVHFTSSNTWETENNNSMSSADIVNVNTKYYGSLSMNGDVDWYKFTTTQNGYFQVEFNHTLLSSSSTYWKIYLYDDSGVNTIDGSNSYFSAVGNSNMTTNSFGVSVGTYYLKITKDSYSGNTYDFTINFSSSFDWETENNNSMSSADTVNLNNKYYGSLSMNGDVDWYKFTTTQKGYFQIEFNHTLIDSSSTYWKIYLYDDSGVNTIDGSNSYYTVSGNSNMTTNSFGVPEGTYYIKIQKDSYSGKIYDFTIKFSSSSVWETENNNSMSSADTITVNSKYYGSLSMNGDVDWYKFQINASSKIAITFNHESINSTSTYWKLYLYDNSGVTSLFNWGRRGDTVSATSDYIDVSAGVYYIKVTKDSYSGKTYEMIITEYHDHVGQWVKKVSPTCTTSGTEERVCTICGNIDTREVDALGHDYGEGVQTKEATLIQTGEITYKCLRCGEVEVKTDKSKVWILPVIGVGAILLIIGVINYIRMIKKS